MGGTRLLGWLVGAAERDAVDWDTVYKEELPRVYNFFRYRIGDRATSEDLTALAFDYFRRRRVDLQIDDTHAEYDDRPRRWRCGAAGGRFGAVG
jgi:hypothetical protein